MHSIKSFTSVLSFFVNNLHGFYHWKESQTFLHGLFQKHRRELFRIIFHPLHHKLLQRFSSENQKFRIPSEVSPKIFRYFFQRFPKEFLHGLFQKFTEECFVHGVFYRDSCWISFRGFIHTETLLLQEFLGISIGNFL